MKNLNICQIADLIKIDWAKWRESHAKPYIQAMAQMEDIDDSFGQESGRSIVRYFLSNASTWRGENAKVIKKELKRRLL